MSPIRVTQMSSYRWTVCFILFFATMFCYMDRQLLSLTWDSYIAPEFGWSEKDYSNITAFFSLVYAIALFVAGRFITFVGTKRGYAIAMLVCTVGATLHTVSGIVVCGALTGYWTTSSDAAIEVLHDASAMMLPVTTTSVIVFMACQAVMAVGQAANFPAAIHITADYFPRKDRAFATALFNTGASFGALLSPVVIPITAQYYGWETAFMLVGSIGYLWIIAWLMLYRSPKHNRYVNATEYAYIRQDDEGTEAPQIANYTIWQCLRKQQTWALMGAKFLTDGVWWFFLFWTPLYITETYGYSTDSQMGMSLIFILYAITLLAVAGGYLPTYYVNRYGISPFSARMRALLIFACIQLIGAFAIPLGDISPWLFILVIGLQGAAHQSWSANLYSLIGDFFPRQSIATVTGIIGMAGGLSSFLLLSNAGSIISNAADAGSDFRFGIYDGLQAAYMIIMCIFSVLYLIGWAIMRLILPQNIKDVKKKLHQQV